MRFSTKWTLAYVTVYSVGKCGLMLLHMNSVGMSVLLSMLLYTLWGKSLLLSLSLNMYSEGMSGLLSMLRYTLWG